MNKTTWLLGACASALLLSACGGGSSDSSTSSTVSVSSVTTDQLAYRKVTNMTITGKNLDKGINISNPGCLKITEVAGGTATQRIFSCKMVAVGTVSVAITAGDGSSLYSGSLTIPLAAQPQVTMVTSLGTLVIELNPAKAPITVDNFLNYTESGFYVNKIFHRVISNFVIQGGGYTADLQQATTSAAIKLEASNGLSNTRGTIAMARLSSPVDSATSQFFFNVVDNSSILDASTTNSGYAVFGKVVTGLDVMDNIKAVPTSTVTSVGMTDVPVTPVVINSMVQTQ